MEQNIELGRMVHINFLDGGSAEGLISMVGDVCTGDGTEKIYQLKVTEDACINVKESQIEDIYDAFSTENFEEFLEYISKKYKLGKLELDIQGIWLSTIWNVISEGEKQYLATFFRSNEIMVRALNIIFYFEKQENLFGKKQTPKKKENVISHFYGNKK